jgi:hypothetical protein
MMPEQAVPLGWQAAADWQKVQLWREEQVVESFELHSGHWSVFAMHSASLLQ